MILSFQVESTESALTRTHRLEEAERLCDRVAILNTTLRSVGRPDELRERLFSRSLVVETLTPLVAPDDVFNSTDRVENWRPEGTSSYVLNVADPRNIAPHVTRALVAAGADVVSISESRHSLEDAGHAKQLRARGRVGRTAPTALAASAAYRLIGSRTPKGSVALG